MDYFYSDRLKIRDIKRLPLTNDVDKNFLSQMCFVTSADDKYFDLMLDSILSIKNTVLLKDIPICIFDLSLSDDRKQFLRDNFSPIHLIEPEWDCPPPHDPQVGLKSLVARIYIDKYIPQYRYYFHIDADAWVQDENALIRYIHLCQKQGIGICTDWASIHHLIYGLCNNEHIRERLKPYADTLIYNAGIWCIDKNNKIYDQWKEVFQELYTQVRMGCLIDQTALNIVLKPLQIETLSQIDNYIFAEQLPLLFHDTLYHTWDNQVIGILHLAAKHHKEYFDRYKVPVLGRTIIERNESLTEMHLKRSLHSITEKSFEYFKTQSVSFREEKNAANI